MISGQEEKVLISSEWRLTGNALVSIFQWEASDALISQQNEISALEEFLNALTAERVKIALALVGALFAYPFRYQKKLRLKKTLLLLSKPR